MCARLTTALVVVAVAVGRTGLERIGKGGMEEHRDQSLLAGTVGWLGRQREPGARNLH